MTWTSLADAIRMVEQRLAERHARDLRAIESALLLQTDDIDHIDDQLEAVADLQRQARAQVSADLRRLATGRWTETC